ncbi:putative endoplasmic reticulum vesicle transporter [Helianthus annuus]|nr:putative endoplasmic reticulum vesicle transporter [Helianthus annuus]
MIFQSCVLFLRKTPRDLTEASLSGAGISILAAISMIFLFGMELHSYLTISTSTAIIIDKSSIEDTVRVDFNISFPLLSCEFASVDVSDVLGTVSSIILTLISAAIFTVNYMSYCISRPSIR